jgi:hypothetical protein
MINFSSLPHGFQRMISIHILTRWLTSWIFLFTGKTEKTNIYIYIYEWTISLISPNEFSVSNLYKILIMMAGGGPFESSLYLT